MPAAPSTTPPSTPPQRPNGTARVGRYAVVIARNVIGGLLIVLSPALGFGLPGPGGLPMFLIGFALITFPGKRRLTSRVLRGRPLDLSGRRLHAMELLVAAVAPPLIVWFVARKPESVIHPARVGDLATAGIYAAAIALAWLAIHYGLRLMNRLVRFMPRIRRRVAPWMRRHGLDLLPPRRRDDNGRPIDGDEILRFGDPYRRWFRRIGSGLRRLFGRRTAADPRPPRRIARDNPVTEK